MISAVAWSPRPKIRAALVEVFSKAADGDVLLAAMPALGKEHDELVLRRLRERLDAWPRECLDR